MYRNYMYRNYMGRNGIAYESKYRHRNPAGRHKRLGGFIYVAM